MFEEAIKIVVNYNHLFLLLSSRLNQHSLGFCSFMSVVSKRMFIKKILSSEFQMSFLDLSLQSLLHPSRLLPSLLDVSCLTVSMTINFWRFDKYFPPTLNLPRRKLASNHLRKMFFFFTSCFSGCVVFFCQTHSVKIPFSCHACLVIMNLNSSLSFFLVSCFLLGFNQTCFKDKLLQKWRVSKI